MSASVAREDCAGVKRARSRCDKAIGARARATRAPSPLTTEAVNETDDDIGALADTDRVGLAVPDVLGLRVDDTEPLALTDQDVEADGLVLSELVMDTDTPAQDGRNAYERKKWWGEVRAGGTRCPFEAVSRRSGATRTR